MNFSKAASHTPILVSVVMILLWVVWQCIGIEAMRPPWEDEVLYTLPALNWATDGELTLPQLGDFMGADAHWRWHMPLFPWLAAGWVKLTGFQLLTIRLFSLLPAALLLPLTAWLCTRLARQRWWPWGLVWLALLMCDKTYVMNSLIGRMEFWCLLAALAGVALTFIVRKPVAMLGAGASLGIAVGFHPLALYLTPALSYLAVAAPSLEPRVSLGRRKSLVFFGLGFLGVILMIVLWFLLDFAATKHQFFAAVQGSSGSSTADNARLFWLGLGYNFRFQPAFGIAAAVAIVFHLWLSFHWRSPASFNRPASIGLLLSLGGMCLFLMRGSSANFNYYTPLVIIAVLLMAALFPAVNQLSPMTRRFALGVFCLVIANNLFFMAAKTRTVWRNRQLLDPAQMHTFLSEQLRGVERCVLPPNLWLYAKAQGLAFRNNYLPLIGQPAATYQDYLQRLLAWQPQVIILDSADAADRADRYFTPQQLALAGYLREAYFERVFRDRFKHDGYRLIVYRRAIQVER